MLSYQKSGRFNLNDDVNRENILICEPTTMQSNTFYVKRSLENLGLPPRHGGAPKRCWALDHHVQWKDVVHEYNAKLLKVDAV